VYYVCIGFRTRRERGRPDDLFSRVRRAISTPGIERARRCRRAARAPDASVRAAPHVRPSAGSTRGVLHPRRTLNATGERPVVDESEQLLPAGFDCFRAAPHLFLPFTFTTLFLPARALDSGLPVGHEMNLRQETAASRISKTCRLWAQIGAIGG